MPVAEFVILALCVARLTRLVTEDGITERYRNRLLTRWPSEDTTFGDSEVTQSQGDVGNVGQLPVVHLEGSWYPLRTYPLASLLTCAWCASFWIGVGITLAWWSAPEPTVIFALPFAFSYVIGFLWSR